MSKTVVYTSITGAYDKLLQPRARSDEYDFICFVGRGEKRCDRDGVWEIRELQADADDLRHPSRKKCVKSDRFQPLSASSCRDKASSQLLARYAKTHPHILLPEYESSVWIDGNIEIVDGTLYDAVKRCLDSGETYCGVPHPARDCVYEEARKCRDMKYISYPALFRIWTTLFLHGVPRHAGLMETNLIFRRHSDPAIVSFDEMWWERILHFCIRDQLSFLWCLRECGVKAGFLLPNGENTRSSSGFNYLLHK